MYRNRMYTMERPKLALDLSYRFDREERTGPFGASSIDTHVLSERIDLETEGWAYHPAMATYRLRLSPEWRQSMDKPDPGSERSSDLFLLGYGLEATLLPYKPYTVDVYARKQGSVLTTSLAPVTESESDAFGATLRLKYKVLPTVVSYAHSTTEQTGFYEAHEERDEARLNMRHTRKDSDTRFDLSYVSRDRIASGVATSTENFYGSLVNTYRIDPKGRNLLTSMLTTRQSQTDVSTSSGWTLSENLNWRHTKRLSSNYNLQYSRDENDGVKINRTMASAGLSHLLYENLTTTVGLSGSSSSQGDSNYGGNLNLSYQRRIPGGTVFASIGQDYRVNMPGIGRIRTTETFSSLPSGDSATLGNQNVYVDSISVVNGSGSPMIKDVDYNITVIGASVQITNLRPVATTFVVTYDYQSPTYDSATYGQSYGIGLQLWDAWRINYRYSHSEQSYIAGIRPAVLPEDIHHTLDSELRWRWSTTRLLYESTDSTTGLSLTRWRVEEAVNLRPTNESFLSGAVYYGRSRLTDTGAEDSFYGLRTDYQRLLSGNSLIKFEALYTAVDGSTIKTVDKGLGASWEWTWGIWRADATYRFLNQEDQNSGQTRNRHTLFIGIRRALF